MKSPIFIITYQNITGHPTGKSAGKTIGFESQGNHSRNTAKFGRQGKTL
jgi:hypothetical protein